MKCPTCGAVSPPTMRFCERDGTRLVVDEAYAAGPSSTDHVEQAPTRDLGGVSDRGRRHGWNEDALSLAAEEVGEPVHVMVVCDGVSQAHNSQRAAQVAAEATRASLLQAARSSLEPSLAMHQAVQAAHEAVCAMPDGLDERPAPTKSQPPGCTLVAALVRGGRATIGWVGDSRAYRLAPDLAQLLTHDHSWFNEVVESGELTPEEAAASPNANAILQAVGPLNFDDDGQTPPPKPDVVSCDLLTGHLLLLCSDGLWKYAPEAGQLAELVRQQPRGTPPLELSRSLVDYANTRGGTDNVTAAILYRRQEGS